MNSGILTTLLWALAGSAVSSTAQELAGADVVRIIAIQPPREATEILQRGALTWRSATLDDLLRAGDRIRTGQNGGVLLQLSDRSLVNVGPESELQFQPPKDRSFLLKLWQGLIYFFHRDEPSGLRVDMPLASAGIRGTEFNLAVAPNGRAVLSLFDGTVELDSPNGSVTLTGGSLGIVGPGQTPTSSPVLHAELVDSIQWCLYYPGILHLGDLELTEAEIGPLQASLQAYRTGDLVTALERYPADRPPASDRERIYLAALCLSTGQLAKARALLAALSEDADRSQPAARTVRLARALSSLAELVQGQTPPPGPAPTLATEWLVESYQDQAGSDLRAALAAARQSVTLAPQFGFGWSRVAELEFGFGKTRAAAEALNEGLTLAPRNAQSLALNGFLLSARNRIREALTWFDQAITADPGLANGWLGRGLCLISQGHLAEGRLCLEAAATVEPLTALLRSYLGKAFAREGDVPRAEAELSLAGRIDPADPTPWLYSALLARELNRVNRAVQDLKQSQALNDNQSLFRSRLLLDQDRAVRSANLASSYQDAGMTELALSEASQAVTADYGNYSAHLFLANSYDALRDPHQISLRHETSWLSEYLVANLLAPVQAGTLSPYVTQHEYSRLFEGNRLGFSSATEYRSAGDWFQTAAHYGIQGNLGYSIEAIYRHENGQRAGAELDQLTLNASAKHQLAPADSLYVLAGYYNAESGDVRSLYDDAEAIQGLEVKETQEPVALLGYHHQWQPGVETLLLAGRLQDTLKVYNPEPQPLLVGVDNSGSVTFGDVWTGVQQRYRSDLEIYTAELQHFWRTERQTTVVGGRFQTGAFETVNETITNLLASPPLLPDAQDVLQTVAPDFTRWSLYAYQNWRITDWIQLHAGVTYDRVTEPANFRFGPVSDGETTDDQVSPHAGLIWTPDRRTTLRAAYSRSLGGVSLDQSFQLEPTRIGGLNKTFRSIIPESVDAANSTPTFESYAIAVERHLGRGAWIGVAGELLKSEVDRRVGGYVLPVFTTVNASAAQFENNLDFKESSLLAYGNALIAQNWSFGIGYRLGYAKLERRFPQIPEAQQLVPLTRTDEAVLHQTRLFALYNHPSGFFAEAEAIWRFQDNRGQLPNSDFWHFNLLAGYRFARRRMEFSAGILNLSDQDYRLNPLNLHPEPPRDRTFVARARFNF